MSKVHAGGVANDAALHTAPFVNAASLSSKMDQTVRLVARVLTTSNGTADVEASDQGRLVVVISSGTTVEPGQVYQFTGRASTPGVLNEVTTTVWGAFNMQNWDQMLQLQSQYPSLFPV